MHKQEKFKNPGLISSLFLIFYSLFRFILEFFREPDSHIGYIFYKFTTGQLVSIIFLLLGILLYFFKKDEK